MELPNRKRNRLAGFDYSTPGAYFITICVKERKNLLGRIVGNGACDIPQMKLSEKGQVLERCIRQVREQEENIQIDNYVIMPNHFHMILTVAENENRDDGLSQAPNPTNSVVSKFISLLKRKCNLTVR